MTTMELPLISIVIPCYKGERYLATAIESCLYQTLSDFEVIIVDDASPDECARIAAGYAQRDLRIRLIRHEKNAGVSAAFNTGFAAARGKYLTRLAQDDEFEPDAFQTFVHFLESHPTVGLMYCDYTCINEQGEFLRSVTLPEAENALTLGNRLGLCVAWRREVWETVGGFDSTYDAAEDFEYWLRISERFEIGKLQGKTLLRIRWHDEMGSYRYADRQERATLRLLREKYPSRVRQPQRFVLQRKAIGEALCSAGSDYERQGNYWKAMGRILQSLATWPLPLNQWKRAKMLAVATLGIAGFRRA